MFKDVSGSLLNKLEINVHFFQIYALMTTLTFNIHFPHLWTMIKKVFDWPGKLFSIDHADLHICSEAYLKERPEILQLMAGMPHALVSDVALCVFVVWCGFVCVCVCLCV